MTEKKLEYYGIIAVKSTEYPITHHHSLTHFFIIEANTTGFNHPGKLYTKKEVLNFLVTNEVYTMIWDYTAAKWKKGAKVSTEVVNNITYLRSNPDSTKRDNLTNLIDYDYFRPADVM